MIRVKDETHGLVSGLRMLAELPASHGRWQPRNRRTVMYRSYLPAMARV
jgi:hypothetical protein